MSEIQREDQQTYDDDFMVEYFGEAITSGQITVIVVMSIIVLFLFVLIGREVYKEYKRDHS